MDNVKIPDGIFSLGGVTLMGIGVVLHIVGLATPNWSVAYYYNVNVNVDVSSSFGLWKICLSDNCVNALDFLGKYTIDSSILDALKASEAFAIFGVLAGLVAIGVGAGRIVGPMMKLPTHYLYPILSPAASTLSFMFILVAGYIWSLKLHSFFLKVLNYQHPLVQSRYMWNEVNIGYSCILSLVSGILIIIGGYLGLLDRRRE